MNYYVIDFETANSKRNSACALGIIEVKDNEIINEWDYLIDPEDYFDPFNTFIHGITEDMVEVPNPSSRAENQSSPSIVVMIFSRFLGSSILVADP